MATEWREARKEFLKPRRWLQQGQRQKVVKNNIVRAGKTVNAEPSPRKNNHFKAHEGKGKYKMKRQSQSSVVRIVYFVVVLDGLVVVRRSLVEISECVCIYVGKILASESCACGKTECKGI